MKGATRSIINTSVHSCLKAVLTVALPRRGMDAQGTSISLIQRDAVDGIMEAPRWSQASILCPRRGRTLCAELSATHTLTQAKWV